MSQTLSTGNSGFDAFFEQLQDYMQQFSVRMDVLTDVIDDLTAQLQTLVGAPPGRTAMSCCMGNEVTVANRQ